MAPCLAMIRLTQYRSIFVAFTSREEFKRLLFYQPSRGVFIHWLTGSLSIDFFDYTRMVYFRGFHLVVSFYHFHSNHHEALRLQDVFETTFLKLKKYLQDTVSSKKESTPQTRRVKRLRQWTASNQVLLTLACKCQTVSMSVSAFRLMSYAWRGIH